MSQEKYKNLCFVALFFVFAAIAGCGGDKKSSPDAIKKDGAQWHSPRGNPSGNAGLADEAVKLPLGLAWKIKVKGGFRSSPAVDSSQIYIGSTGGSVYAFDKRTGKQAWEFKTGGRVIAPAVLNGDSLFIGSGSRKMYELDTRTGKPRQSPFEAKGVINAGAAVSGGYIVFGAYDNYLYVLEKSNMSRIVWHRRLGDWIDSTPTIVDGMIYVGCNDGYIYKFKLDDGELQWRFKTSGPVYSTPIVSGGKVYFTSWDGNAYALNADGGKKLWATKVDEQVSASLAIKDGKLYGGGAFDGPFFALRASDGKLLNSFKTYGGFDAGPVVSGDTIYVGSYDDHFYAVDTKSFKILWKRPMRDHVRANAAVAGGAIYFADLGGRLFAFAPVK